MTTEEQRQARREAYRRWVEAHPEEARELARQSSRNWRAKHPGEARAARKEWGKRYRQQHGKTYRSPGFNQELANAKSRERTKNLYASDPEFREKVKARVREWRAKHPEKAKELNRLTPAKQQKARAWTLAQYGLTPEEYQAKLAAQDGVCAICRQPERNLFRGKPRPLAVDHQHGTGMVRGLCCSRCNNMIGRAEDDPAILMAGAQYLIRWSGTPMQYVPPER